MQNVNFAIDRVCKYGTKEPSLQTTDIDSSTDIMRKI